MLVVDCVLVFLILNFDNYLSTPKIILATYPKKAGLRNQPDTINYAVLSERLRSGTANLMCYARAGSNPADRDFFCTRWVNNCALGRDLQSLKF